METPGNFFSLMSLFESESIYESLSKSKFENSSVNVTEKRMIKKAILKSNMVCPFINVLYAT